MPGRERCPAGPREELSVSRRAGASLVQGRALSVLETAACRTIVGVARTRRKDLAPSDHPTP